jgi:thioredoxin reductase (NADPH)
LERQVGSGEGEDVDVTYGDDVVDVLVVGAGMAGLAAAYHAAARGASVLCVESSLVGGQIASVGRIDDFPLPEDMSGATLANAYLRRASDLGASLRTANAEKIIADGDGVRVQTDVDTYRARRVILASGARRRVLAVPGEAALTKRGISDCAWCDGGLYRGASVAVIGGGDAAVQAALHLATFAERVTLIVRGSELRARRRYAFAAADNMRIDFIWETVVEGFTGVDALEHVRVRDRFDDSIRNLAFDGAFVYAGTSPAAECVPDEIARDESGRIVTDAGGRTSLSHVFCAGSLRSGCLGGVAAALADGERVGTAVTTVDSRS